VGMPRAAPELGFAEEPLLALGPTEVPRREQLERDLPRRLVIVGAEHLAHAAVTDHGAQLEAPIERVAHGRKGRMRLRGSVHRHGRRSTRAPSVGETWTRKSPSCTSSGMTSTAPASRHSVLDAFLHRSGYR